MARPLPIIAGVYRCAFDWQVTGLSQTASNVMHFQAPTLTESALYSAISAHVAAAMWPAQATNNSVATLSITKLDGSSATQIFVPTGAAWAGPATPGDFSPGTALVISLRTANRGRRYRGRVFLPFPLESQVANGVATNGANLASAGTAWEAFRSGMATASAPLVVASYGYSLHYDRATKSYTEVTWTPFATPVTSCIVESTLTTQRRRQTRLR